MMTIGVLNISDSISKNSKSNSCLNQKLLMLGHEDVNMDGVVDLDDLILVENDSNKFVKGYGPTDINLDGIVDAIDIIMVYIVSQTFP